MKKAVFVLAAMVMAGISLVAQSTYNLVIFSEDGEAFYAIVNGIRQNDKPETNIRITGLNSEALNVRVEFVNPALPKLKQNMMPEFGYEHTVNIRRNRKQEIKMQYFGKVELAEAPKGSATNVAYHTAENPISETSTQSSSTSGLNTGDGSVSITNSTTTVTSSPNVNINMNSTGVSIQMNTNGQTSSSTTSTITTTTTGYTSTSTGQTKSGGVKNPNPNSGATIQPVESAGGCRSAISQSSYDKIRQSVESKPFSETKMSTARVATKNNCLSAAQIKGICQLFSMDEDKLAYAKFAYEYCVDKGNYFSVSEAFTFSTTTEELNQFIENR